jgi:hypothetical protein
MCGPKRRGVCIHGEPLRNKCDDCGKFCAHETADTGKFTGEGDPDFEAGLPVTVCVNCGKEFVTVHKGKDDAPSN